MFILNRALSNPLVNLDLRELGFGDNNKLLEFMDMDKRIRVFGGRQMNKIKIWFLTQNWGPACCSQNTNQPNQDKEEEFSSETLTHLSLKSYIPKETGDLRERERERCD